MNTETENTTLDMSPPASATTPDNLPSLSPDRPLDEDCEKALWPSKPPDPPLVEGDGVRQVHIGWLKPHRFSIKIYGHEAVDKDLVKSIEDVGILTPLKVTVDGVIISGHRRLEAAKQTHLKTVPVDVVCARARPGALEEQILEANRARVKDNEQKVREFTAYKCIETARAKDRNGYRWDLVPNSAPGDAEPKPGVSPRPLQTLVREVGKARDLAAAKVGMAGSSAADGEKVVAALDRLWTAANYEFYRQLREALLRSIHAALKLGLERGWIPQAAKKPDRQSAKVHAMSAPGPAVSNNLGVVEAAIGQSGGKPVEATPSAAAPLGAAAESYSPSHVGNVTDAQEAAHANIDPGEQVSVQINARTGVEQEFTPSPMSMVDGQNNQPSNVLSVVTAPEPQSHSAENSPSAPGTIFRLADGSEVMIASAEEGDLITDEKLRAILQISVSLGDKDAAGVEALARRQRFEMSVAEMMNRLGKASPNISAQRLWTEFCTANRIFQKQLKLN